MAEHGASRRLGKQCPPPHLSPQGGLMEAADGEPLQERAEDSGEGPWRVPASAPAGTPLSHQPRVLPLGAGVLATRARCCTGPCGPGRGMLPTGLLGPPLLMPLGAPRRLSLPPTAGLQPPQETTPQDLMIRATVVRALQEALWSR